MLKKYGEEVTNLYADGAYDKSAIYKLLQTKRISGKLPEKTQDTKLQYKMKQKSHRFQAVIKQ